MIPVIKRLENVDYSNPVRAVRQLAEHITELERQLEDMFMKLDNVNLLTLDLDDMEMVTDNGTVISGDRIKIKSPTGEVFEVGYDKTAKKFVFTMPEITTINAVNINASAISADTIIRGGETI